MITYAVKFSFVDANGYRYQRVAGSETAMISPTTTPPRARRVARRETIHEEMQRDMAATIIRRIGIALRHYTPASTQ